MSASRRILPVALAATVTVALSGCAATIDRTSFYPPSAPAPEATLQAPEDYVLTETLLDVGGGRVVHAVRLDRPDSEDTLVYSGGNMSFTAGQSGLAAALADAYGSDIVLWDYPGRGGTDVPQTMQAAIELAPAVLRASREEGWIGSGRLVLHGLSFGGSQAAAMAGKAGREIGADALVIEGSAADIAKVGRNFVPWYARPFVRLKVDPELATFRYLDYAVDAGVPILLIASTDDKVVTARNMRDFEVDLRARGASVTFAEVPGQHGRAMAYPVAHQAIASFLAGLPRD